MWAAWQNRALLQWLGGTSNSWFFYSQSLLNYGAGFVRSLHQELFYFSWLCSEGVESRGSRELMCFLDSIELGEWARGALWRVRFRVVGMGFFYHVVGSSIFIKAGHSHLEWLLLAYLYRGRVTGYKNRVLVVRSCTQAGFLRLVERVAAISPPNVYRRKGIALSRTRFFFRRGKKKFV